MQIGIIGTGNMGSALGRQWAAKGHRVLFGSRAPEKGSALAADAGHGARAGSYADAAAFAEVVLLATPWAATRDAITAAGRLAGKVLLDCTNPLAPDFGSLVVGHSTSAAEMIAGWTPGAKVVKAYNAIPASAITEAPRFGYPESPSIFYAGDDAGAKAQVAPLITELGFDAVDAGPLTSARYLEPLAFLWVYMAYGLGRGPNSAFRLMRKG